MTKQTAIVPFLIYTSENALESTSALTTMPRGSEKKGEKSLAVKGFAVEAALQPPGQNSTGPRPHASRVTGVSATLEGLRKPF